MKKIKEKYERRGLEDVEPIVRYWLEHTYLIADALIKKETGTEQDRVIAKDMLISVINEENYYREVIDTAIFYLCEIFLRELRETNNEEILNDLKFYAKRLEKVAYAENTYPWLIEAMWLQAQISLLELDVETTQNLYDEAQNIAEEKGIQKLAVKVSNEHDLLLDQLDLWDDFTLRLPSIAERLELSHIEERLEELLRGTFLKEIEIEPEDAVLLLILGSSGVILFSDQFDLTTDVQVIEEVITTIKQQSQDDKIKADMIKRMRHRDLTYLLTKTESLIFCYVFLGRSYLGIRKLKKFKLELEKDRKFLNVLVSKSQEGLNLDYSDRVKLNEMIDSIYNQASNVKNQI
jgi:hypothetical protein